MQDVSDPWDRYANLLAPHALEMSGHFLWQPPRPQTPGFLRRKQFRVCATLKGGVDAKALMLGNLPPPERGWRRVELHWEGPSAGRQFTVRVVDEETPPAEGAS